MTEVWDAVTKLKAAVWLPHDSARVEDCDARWDQVSQQFSPSFPWASAWMKLSLGLANSDGSHWVPQASLHLSEEAAGFREPECLVSSDY